MDNDSLYLKNKEMIGQLQEKVQWAATQWLNDCWNQSLFFTILESFRSSARQLWLYGQGRIRPGPIVTWTLNSEHCKGLAVDVLPRECTLEQLSDAARVYQVIRPQNLLEVGDNDHFSLANAIAQPPPTIISPEERLAGLRRRLSITTDKERRQLIQTAIAGILRRLQRRGEKASSAILKSHSPPL